MRSDLTILMVEDDPDDVVLLRTTLSRIGVNNPVQVVRGGDQAVQYLKGDGRYANRAEFPFPGVIFSDLQMPRMSGFDVLRWLRGNPHCSAIPMIILTGSKIDEDIQQAYRMGANAYLVKPMDIAELQSMVKAACEFWDWCEKPLVAGNC
jgi:CheY-like chemotaxis protein